MEVIDLNLVLYYLFWVLFVTLLLTSTLLLVWILKWRQRLSKRRNPNAIAFFHPHCSSGGGGERVLWKMIQVLGSIPRDHPLEIVIYTIDAPSPTYSQDVIQHVRERFSIDVTDYGSQISFVHLHQYAHYLDPSPRFSLAMESWGTMKLAFVALQQVTPHLFLDTTGCAFTFAVARILANCHVGAYVHYPTISTDMLQLVYERRPSYNHNPDLSSRRLTTYAKLIYYCLFAFFYGTVGSLARLVLVNSTWTFHHIRSLWYGLRNPPLIVFPPCMVQELQTLPLEPRERVIVSIGQFRPEKDHSLQLQAMALLQKRLSAQTKPNAKLVLIGSCRGPSDKARVEELRQEAASLEVNVEFCLNQPYSVVRDWLSRARIGIHTMWNEHFGIGIVEMMAAGLIVVAHNSGGPRSDILVDAPNTGFLAKTAEEYASCMQEALETPSDKIAEIQIAARQSSLRFSDEAFDASWKRAILESNLLPT